MFTTPELDQELLVTREFLSKLDNLCYYRNSIRTTFRVEFEDKLCYLYLWGRVIDHKVDVNSTVINRLTHREGTHDYGFILDVHRKAPISGLLHWSGPRTLEEAEDLLDKPTTSLNSWRWSTHT